MAFSQERYYRQITSAVIGYCLELETGVVVVESIGRIFAPELIHYKIDVERALKQFSAAEQKALLLVHRDGLSFEDAVSLAGIKDGHPKAVIVGLEVRVGRLFERLKLNDLIGYLSRR